CVVMQMNALLDPRVTRPTLRTLYELRSLLRNNKTHVASVVEDPPAIRAGDHFLIALAGHDDLALELHVATAADAVRDAYHHIVAFALAKTFVARQNAFIHSRRELIPVRFQGGQFLLQV